MRTVVCEDDPGVRSVIAGLAAQHDHEVLAETDNSMEAIELVERFGAEVLVLDLALQAGSGSAALESIARGDVPPIHVVVFSAYAHDLSASHEISIIEKPDFDGLAAVFERLSGTTDSPSTVDRRRQRDGHGPRPGDRHVGHDEDAAHVFYTALTDARPGDSLLAVAVRGGHGTPDKVADAARSIARVQDRVLRRPDCAVMLLIGGSSEAAGAVSQRLARSWHELHDPLADVITASAILGDLDEPIDQFTRVCEELKVAVPAGQTSD